MPIQLASLFQDHAVLQRNRAIPVWGWTEPRTKVCVSLNGVDAVGFSNELGRFEVRLPAMPEGGPFVLRAENLYSGDTVEVGDILVGEVWLCSGQSNMVMSMQSCRANAAEAIRTADFPEIRYFTVAQKSVLGGHELVEGDWQSVTPDSVKTCSAVAYAFARSLHTKLNLPIGIIVSAQGGTIIESWTSRLGLANNPKSAVEVAEYDVACNAPERMSKDVKRNEYSLFPLDPGNEAFAKGWANADFDDSDWPKIELPKTWQAAGYDHTGVFWFRKRIQIPESWIGQELRLKVGAVDKMDVTYFNGVQVGATGRAEEDQYWAFQRNYAVPEELVSVTDVVIAVRAYSFKFDGGMIGPADAMQLHQQSAPEEAIAIDGEWRLAIEHDLGPVESIEENGHQQMNSPHMLFDNMIAPLIPYAIKGATWYQGESSEHMGIGYFDYLSAMIQDWRYLWGQGEFLFHVVQLPDYLPKEEYQSESNWAGIRYAQSKILELPETGIAVTLGLGDAEDIHPTNKLPVGERLAQSALVKTYGQAGEPCGPVLKTSQIEDGAIVCEFDYTGDGLATTDGEAPAGVFIAGEDLQFVRAHASTDGKRLVCSHPAIKAPYVVRYAWADNPEAYNLCNSEGQIASPFQTRVV